MSLLKPTIVVPVAAFDATQGTTIYFTIPFGSDQPESNDLYIYDNVSGDTPIEVITTAASNRCVISGATSFVNGHVYWVEVVTKRTNSEGQTLSSRPSNRVQIHCYTAPIFAFVGTPNVRTSEYNFIAQYSQAENELLNTYVFNLYDVSNVLIASSGELPASALTPTVEDGVNVYELSYRFSGLTNYTEYRIEVTGITVYNTILQTNKQSFVVVYEIEKSVGAINLINDCKSGSVIVRSYIDVNNGKTDKDVEYIGGEEADLRDNMVNWNDQKSPAEGNLLVRAIFRAANIGEDIIVVDNTDDTDVDNRFKVSVKCEAASTVPFTDGCKIDPLTTSVQCSLYDEDNILLATSSVLDGVPNDLTKFRTQMVKDPTSGSEYSIDLILEDELTAYILQGRDANGFTDEIGNSYFGDNLPSIFYFLGDGETTIPTTIETSEEGVLYAITTDDIISNIIDKFEIDRICGNIYLVTKGAE